jgi:hypothetical protein
MSLALPGLISAEAKMEILAVWSPNLVQPKLLKPPRHDPKKSFDLMSIFADVVAFLYCASHISFILNSNDLMIGMRQNSPLQFIQLYVTSAYLIVFCLLHKKLYENPLIRITAYTIFPSLTKANLYFTQNLILNIQDDK